MHHEDWVATILTVAVLIVDEISSQFPKLKMIAKLLVNWFFYKTITSSKHYLVKDKICSTVAYFQQTVFKAFEISQSHNVRDRKHLV